MDGFVWCHHCAGPHEADTKFCPRTGKAMTAKAVSFASAPAPKAEQIGPGTIVDKKYYVVGLIGRGGQSIVYEAIHTKLGQRVALKFLAQEPDRKALDRFEQEARVAATIAHPNICRSYDLGTLKSGTRFIVMERFVGESLQRVLAREGALVPALAVHLGSQVLAALEAAHKAKVIHRDIKPGNIFVEIAPGVDPIAKVLDFGFAKMFGVPSSIGTTIGRALGTPAYMSPEQLMGKPLDGRCDLFSTGVVFYEMLTGRRPWNGTSVPEISSSILRDIPPPLDRVRPDVPPALARIVARALEKDPRQRFSSADEFRRTLRKLTHPERARPRAPSATGEPRFPSLGEDDSSSGRT